MSIKSLYNSGSYDEEHFSPFSRNIKLIKFIPMFLSSLGFDSQLSYRSGPVTSTARHRRDVSSKLCCLGSKPVEMGPDNPIAILCTTASMMKI